MNIWEEICNLVIRPQRSNYDYTVALGPKLFTLLGNKVFERKDFAILNPRNLKLQCSWYQPIESQRPAKKMPCVVYCHGNCGSRQDALDAVQILLPNNITVFSFDFSGSGLSEGEYVSLGYYEREDIAAVVEYLWKSGTVSRIGLWGRSMGAATSLLYASEDQSLSAIVVDSPFMSLEKVIEDLVKSHQSWIPKTAINVATNAMRSSILSRAQFDIKKCSPISVVQNCFVPVLFGHAEGDNFIKIWHSERLYEKYNGDKSMVRFEGDHNSERPDYFFDAVAIFFYNTLISNDPYLDRKEYRPKRISISRKMKVGKKTKKGDEIVQKMCKELDDFEEVESEEEKESKNEAIGQLPTKPTNQQILLPHSLDLTHPNEENNIINSLITSLEDDLKKTENEEKKKELTRKITQLKLSLHE